MRLETLNAESTATGNPQGPGTPFHTATLDLSLVQVLPYGR